jgi:hypothetical protein
MLPARVTASIQTVRLGVTWVTHWVRHLRRSPMTEQPTDRSTVVPDAAPLSGTPADPDQLDPSEVLPSGKEREVEHLVEDDER